jgi:membrane protease YdiL (CAAX protease family)
MIILLMKALRDVQRRPLRTLLTIIGITLGVAGLVAINHTGHNLADAQRETIAKILDFTELNDRVTPEALVAALALFFYLWLIGPICEEIIFRGLLWGAVERLRWSSERVGRFAAFAVSTAVFAVSHLEPLRTTLLVVIAIPIGLARLVTGRLLGSIVAHQVNNFFPALAILLTALGVLQL